MEKAYFRPLRDGLSRLASAPYSAPVARSCARRRAATRASATRLNDMPHSGMSGLDYLSVQH